MSNTKAFRRYLLNPTHAPRGWLLLPHGVQRLDQTGCEFLSKHDYALLLDCDGQTDIAYDELPEADGARYDDWEKQAVIRRCEGEEAMLLPEQRYRYYNNRYKDNVQWSITGKCNYRCRHCFMSAPHAATGEPS
jgi:hypothetical protein